MANGQFDEEADAAVIPPGGIIPGGGTATIGTETMPFNRQVWDPSDWARYVQRANAYESEKQKAESDREFMDFMSKNAAVMRSQQAVNAALNFQAIRSYERDLQRAKAAGLSDEQAAIQAYYRNPRAVSGTQMASMLRATSPAMTSQLGQVVPVDLPGGESLGHVIRTGPESGTFRPVAKPPELRMTVSPPSEIGGVPIGQPRQSVSGPASMVQEYMRTNTPVNLPRTQANSVIKIRRKRDGKTGTYRGNPADIPKEYEIIR